MENMNEYLEKQKKMLDKTGKFDEAKKNIILENFKKHFIEREKEKEEQKKYLEELTNKMIPKEKLEDGAYYNGVRFRGAHVAMWDEKLKLFRCINYTMGDFFLEKLNHFADEINTKTDGFAPLEKIETCDMMKRRVGG